MKTILKISILLLVILTSCKPEPKIDKDIGFTSNDFPVKVGNWWKYKVNDLYGGKTDILTVKVMYQLSDNEYYCTLELQNTIVDSNKITISKNKIEYEGLNSNYSYFGNFILSFPFKTGDKWIGNKQLDTVKVISTNENIIINGNNYSPVYFVKRAFYLLGGYSITQTIEISPNIGIVRQSINLYDGFNVQKQNFSLIDYHLE